MNSLGIIISREYMERVAKKSFILTTLITPLIMVAMMVLPTVIMLMSGHEERRVAVIDDTGYVLESLESDDDVKFVKSDAPRDSAMADKSLFGLLIIDKDVETNPNAVTLICNEAGGVEFESNLTRQIKNIIEAKKLKSKGIENLDKMLAEVDTPINLKVVRTDREEGENVSSIVSMVVGFILAMILYMFLLLYGQMVMTSVIEEKSNRVLEVMVSSVSPFQMMLGKVLGIALVAVTQVAIWGVIMLVTSGLILPSLVSADVMTQVNVVSAGGTVDVASGVDSDLVNMIVSLGNVGFIVQLLLYVLLYFVGGFMLYASMSAAIGSAVDNMQDASQLNTFIVLPMIISFVLNMASVNDPNGPIAFWGSMIPFTSPIMMLTRVAGGVPTWEIILSLVILYASFIGMVWFAAKIYRVGIFMYGKKPTIKEIIRWVKYK